MAKASETVEQQGMEHIAIHRIGGCLLVAVQTELHDRIAKSLKEDLTAQIVATRAGGVLIDISGLDIVDSFMGRTLSNIATIARVLDAVTVVVGMRPQVAITLVELGLSLKGIRTALNVDKGLEIMKPLLERPGNSGADTQV